MVVKIKKNKIDNKKYRKKSWNNGDTQNRSTKKREFKEYKPDLNNSFRVFNFKDEIQRAIEKIGFEKPSEIQEKTIPLILEGYDLIGQAQTGTGKTAAFSLPIIEKIDPNKDEIQALIIVPTRELAIQVSVELWKFGKYLGYKAATVFGGVSYKKQIDYIKESKILVATPGRLLDLLKTKKININPKIVVLDEADEMLNMGFITDIKEIFKFVKNREQTLMFSATIPNEIKKLALEILNNPKDVRVKAKSLSSENVKQYFYLMDENKKDEALIELIKNKKPQKLIIFSRTKKEVERLAKFLNAYNFRALALHGDIDQWKRQQVLKDFRKFGNKILVATDVAARGIDIKNISHIINYHIPLNPEPYIHRIGRTGRAGEKGEAHTFVLEEEIFDLQKIEKEIQKKMEKGEILKEKNLFFIKKNLLKQKINFDGEELFEIMRDEFEKNPEGVLKKSLSYIVDFLKREEKVSFSIREIEKILNNYDNRGKEKKERRGDFQNRRGRGWNDNRKRFSRKREKGGKNYKEYKWL